MKWLKVEHAVAALGAPTSQLILRIKSRISFGTAGHPDLQCRIFQLQNRPKAFRCQPVTVAGLTIMSAESQSDQVCERQAQKIRSIEVNRGRFTER
jgi:hypothetical protein